GSRSGWRRESPDLPGDSNGGRDRCELRNGCLLVVVAVERRTYVETFRIERRVVRGPTAEIARRHADYAGTAAHSACPGRRQHIVQRHFAQLGEARVGIPLRAHRVVRRLRVGDVDRIELLRADVDFTDAEDDAASLAVLIELPVARFEVDHGVKRQALSEGEGVDESSLIFRRRPSYIKEGCL